MSFTIWMPERLQEEIVALLTELTELGVDAGAQRIGCDSELCHELVPSVSTIWADAPATGLRDPSCTSEPGLVAGYDEFPVRDRSAMT